MLGIHIGGTKRSRGGGNDGSVLSNATAMVTTIDDLVQWTVVVFVTLCRSVFLFNVHTVVVDIIYLYEEKNGQYWAAYVLADYYCVVDSSF